MLGVAQGMELFLIYFYTLYIDIFVTGKTLTFDFPDEWKQFGSNFADVCLFIIVRAWKKQASDLKKQMCQHKL